MDITSTETNEQIEPSNTLSEKNSALAMAMKEEFIEKTNQAVDIRRKIEEAKTETKKKFYKKKLKINNENAIKLLIAIEKLSILKSSEEAQK